MSAGRGAEEWCKVSPLIVDSGLQFIFNNTLDPQSVELVRKQPANPQLYEVFDWKTHIVHLEGPISRFNGDYRPGVTQTQPDLITRSTNLACIDNLAKSVPHAVALEGNGVKESSDTVAGSTTSLTADLKAGTYTFFCPVGNHRQAGMEGTLTVK